MICTRNYSKISPAVSTFFFAAEMRKEAPAKALLSQISTSRRYQRPSRETSKHFSSRVTDMEESTTSSKPCSFSTLRNLPVYRLPTCVPTAHGVLSLRMMMRLPHKSIQHLIVNRLRRESILAGGTVLRTSATIKASDRESSEFGLNSCIHHKKVCVSAPPLTPLPSHRSRR